MTATRKRILTGDRPTGKLHLGHYVGSLANRVKLQYEYDSYILIADVQALSTHFEKNEHIHQDLLQIAEDYFAAGLDPEAATIVIQSRIPEIHELTMYYAMFTSVNVLRHNPTVKSEAQQYGFSDMSYGFLGYPISQAADISIFKAHLVPVGEDQIPHIELARKIVRRFNELYKPVLVIPEAMLGSTPRLIGLDGRSKMSKSLNNAIYLSDNPEVVWEKVRNAVTDPARIHKNDPGHPEVCMVYAYHQVFNAEEVESIAEECRQGAIGCIQCKKNLNRCLNELLEPMHDRRAKYAGHPERIVEILMEGHQRGHQVARETMLEVRDAMEINYFKETVS